MAARADITPELCRQLLRYDPETGKLFWLAARKAVRVGAEAGHLEADGYIRVSINDIRIPAHRIAFAITTGRWPIGSIDHRDGVRGNNAWGNLRECSASENSQNRHGPAANNRTGHLGVSFDRRTGRYRAQIMAHGRAYHLGRFDTVEGAAEARLAAKRRLHTHGEI